FLLHISDHTLYIVRTVISPVPDFCKGQRSVIPQGLQGSRTYTQPAADIVVVHPFTYFFPAVFTAQTFHPLHEAIQLGGNLLESPFFKADDFHCLHYFLLNIYSKFRNRTGLLQPICHHVSSSYS